MIPARRPTYQRWGHKHENGCILRSHFVKGRIFTSQTSRGFADTNCAGIIFAVSAGQNYVFPFNINSGHHAVSMIICLPEFNINDH